MMVKNKSAIGHRKKESLPKVKASVPSHSQPEIPGPAQCKCEDESGNRNVQRPNDSLAGVSEMSGPKHKRETDRGRPEAKPSRQGVLGISSKHEFFRKANQNERCSPQ